jgi:hypothetical protein
MNSKTKRQLPEDSNSHVHEEWRDGVEEDPGIHEECTDRREPIDEEDKEDEDQYNGEDQGEGEDETDEQEVWGTWTTSKTSMTKTKRALMTTKFLTKKGSQSYETVCSRSNAHIVLPARVVIE